MMRVRVCHISTREDISGGLYDYYLPSRAILWQIKKRRDKISLAIWHTLGRSVPLLTLSTALPLTPTIFASFPSSVTPMFIPQPLLCHVVSPGTWYRPLIVAIHRTCIRSMHFVPTYPALLGLFHPP
jgi:hypothetical protein